MTIGISDDHRALHETVRRWAEQHSDRTVVREQMGKTGRPPFWDDLAKLGWLGVHLPERYGGEGYGLAELAVVLEELGRACAPGPMVPTVMASAVIDRFGSDAQKERWLPGLADGSLLGAVAVASTAAGDAAGTETGIAVVLGGAEADVVVVSDPNGDGWRVCERVEGALAPVPPVDETRSITSAQLDQLSGERLGRTDGAAVPSLVGALLAAEAVGVHAWCVETASDYARERVQFGRPIGQFQAVKHRCANMLLSLELARAAVWDACRASDDERHEPDAPHQRDEGAELARAAAVAVAPIAAFEAAKDCVQVLGGIGYTWEHDAHLYLKRALVTKQLLDAPGAPARVVGELAVKGTRRSLRVELPVEADPYRDEVRAFLDDLRSHGKSDWNRQIAESGYLVPYWPRPWGRDAGPVEQLVIDEEFAAARVRRPHLQVGAWVLPTLIAHATPEQQKRWIAPTLRGEILWCQMFSEPGAGSDLASLTTRAERVEGGWSITGQKVWTTMAHIANWAICLARTNPDVPKHEGITCFMLDMTSPGIDVRPLRELTGAEMFNEVFLDAVFVPDDCVVGGVDHGWEAARTTLANERVSMGSGSSFGPGLEAVVQMVEEGDPQLPEVGALVAEGHAIAVMGLRSTLRALAGAKPGSEASVRKLLGVEHEQHVQEVGLSLLGAGAAYKSSASELWIGGFLGNRALSIAGGTSDVQRNIIAERLLDLPRDPEPGGSAPQGGK